MTATATGGTTATGSTAPAGRAARPGGPSPGHARRRRIGSQRWLSQRTQAVFASSAAGSGAFTGLEAGIVVLALAMAVGCAWGLSRRLAQYR